MSDFAIRDATERDLPSVMALISALAEFEKLAGPDADAHARFAKHFSEKRFDLLVAERAGEVIAYALYFATYSTFRAQPSLYLEDLFVRPAERGRGIGEALLRKLAAIAVARGCGRFEWTVLDWNERAQKFYRSLGAAIHPEWQHCRVDGDALTRLAR
jgi:ribosomal protein S18 acetylase RimI-like enzyme